VSKTPEALAQIYIVDNDSTDQSKAFIVDHFPQVKWIQNSKNYGFAEGYNQGLIHIEEPLYCLMNSDIEVTDNWLEPILEQFETQPHLGAAQPKILDLRNRTQFEYAGGSGGFYDRLGYAVCRGRYFDHVEEDKGQYDDMIPIFWASGCCIFIRKEVFREVGGFDGDYFAHQEEIDLCWRVNNYGYTVLSIPQSTVYHYGGGSLPYGSYFKSFLNFRNSLYNLFKNLTALQLAIVLPLRLTLDGIAAIHSVLVTKKMVVLKSIFFAHIDFYKHLPKLIAKRKKIQHKGYPNVIVKKHILIDYYLFKCNKYSQL
jgi:GT2 family glycosyltransferase